MIAGLNPFVFSLAEKDAKEIPDLPTRAEPERFIATPRGTMPRRDHSSTSMCDENVLAELK